MSRSLSVCLAALIGNLGVLGCGRSADSQVPLTIGATATRADALLGAETAVDDDVISAPSPLTDVGSRIAFDGTNYLVVWVESGTYGINAVRVDQTGAVLDPSGIAICNNQIVWTLDVDFNGTDYVVVWVDTTSDNVHAARVTTAGVVRDPNGFNVTNDAPDQGEVAVACGSANCVAVWEDPRSGMSNDLYGARIAGDGSVLDPSGFVVVNDTLNDELDPAIAFDGTNYLVVYHHYDFATRRVKAVRLAADGQVLAPGAVSLGVVTNEIVAPTVAFGDAANGYLAVWMNSYRGYGARIGVDGVPVDATPVAIHVAGNFYSPEVTFGSAATGWMVTWYNPLMGGHEVYATRVSTGGVALDPSGINVSNTAGDQNWPAIASTGSGYLVTWTNGATPTADIYGKRMDLAGSRLDTNGRLFSVANNVQTAATAAWDGTDALVAWSDNRNGNLDIYAARISGAGSLVDTTAIQVTANAAGDTEPAIAFNGTNYLIAWTRNSGSSADVIAVRVGTDGTVVPPGEFILVSATGEQSAPTVAALGSDFLVAWQDMRAMTSEILGVRVDNNGGIRDASPLLIGVAANDQLVPAASSDGTNWLVVWQDRRSGGWDVYGARIDAAGTVLESTGIPIATTTYARLEPVVAFGGGEYLVAWYNNAGGDEIYAARVSTAGVVLDPSGIRVTTIAGIQRLPAVTWDGTAFLLAWQSSASTSGPGIDIHGSRVSTGGAVIPGGPIAIANSAQPEGDVALAPRGSSRVLVVYQKDPGLSVLHGYRAFFRTEDFAAAGASCGSAIDCQTFFCADSVCCQTSCSGNCDTCAAGSGLCSDDDALCTGNCDACVSGTCAAQVDLCTGNCGGCAGEDTAFDCVADDTACTGNCDVCAGSGNAFDCVAVDTECGGTCATCSGGGTDFSCAGDVDRCVGNCDQCEGSDTVFDCVGDDSLCSGNCDTCSGGGNAFSCATVPALCTGNCDVCSGSGNDYSCAADSSLCLGNCDGCVGSGTAYSCAAVDALCTGDCDVCSGSGATFDCAADQALCSGACDECAGSGNLFACQSVVDNTPCGDGLACNGVELCGRGTCQPDAVFSCDDNNICTSDSCAEPGGCLNELIANCCVPLPTCEDGGVDAAGCLTNPDQHPACNDDDDCTTDRCDTNRCVHATLPSCRDAGPGDSAMVADSSMRADAAVAADTATAFDTATAPDAATTPDTATVDTAPVPDAHVDDARAPDAARPDQATAADRAAQTDTTVVDSATVRADAGAAEEPDGCGCAASASAPGNSAQLLALALFALGARRRR